MVVKVKKTAVLLLMLVFAFSCGRIFLIEAEKARAKAGDFLYTLYKMQDVDAAYAMTDSNFESNNGTGALEIAFDTAKVKYGPFIGFKADSYIVDSDSRTVELFYRALSEKGVLHHRISVRLDENGKYKVTGMETSPMPFGPFRTERKFKSE